jgi:predicted transcriptional regulator of viral defense system
LTFWFKIKKLKLRRIERITAEAFRQNGVLTTVDLEWILGITPTLIRELLEEYHEHFGIILPTAGTVLDMG